MYFYFYDKFTQDPKFESALIKVETALIDLGINGRVEKLSIFKNARELIEDGIKKGAHTVIAVGDDKTFVNVVNIVAPYDVTLGFIPVTETSRYAKVLGMPTGEEAAAVLSRRLSTTVDLGKIGDQYFLGSVSVPVQQQIQMRCDDSYTVAANLQTKSIRVMNLGEVLGSDQPHLAHVDDGRLELVVTPEVEGGFRRRKGNAKASQASVFPFRALAVSTMGESASLHVEHTFMVNTPCTIEAVPNALKLIVGRDRQFARDAA